MDERRDRDRSRHASETRGFRGQESGYFSPERRCNGNQQTEEVTQRTFRYYERGHPLPSNYLPEPKACVPYRNVSLGTPSQRRNTETYLQDSWRSESPQRYTYHSNFRRGTDSETNSPTRHNSVSPERYKTETPTALQRGSSRSRYSAQTLSHSSSQLPSHVTSRQTSGRSSPAHKRSITSRTASPSRGTVSQKRQNSLLLQNGEYDLQKGCSRESRSPSQASHKHSLDSEILYRNLESISRRCSSTVQKHSYEGSQLASPQTRTTINSLANTHTCNSRELSPSRNGHRRPSQTQQRPPGSSPRHASSQGSSHSLLSLPVSPGSSSSRRGADSQLLGGSMSQTAVTETVNRNAKVSGDRSSSSFRRGMDALLVSEPPKTAVEAEEVGMTLEDYLLIADIPKILLESEEEPPGLRWRNQSPSPCRNQSLRTYRYQDETDISSSRFEPDERGRGRERGRDRREKCRDSENGRTSRRHSVASLHKQSSQSGKHRSSVMEQHAPAECSQMQGWMSRLDEHGKWRKHWFVLSETSLRFYRDSEAEESDDLDGEIDLNTCVNVSDCDVDKNYGLQLQTKRAVFTFTAMTSRIRRNWVKLLKQAIPNNSHQSDEGSEKEDPLPRRALSCQPPAQFSFRDRSHEPATSNSTTTENFSHQTSAAEVGSDAYPACQREEGEGWDREQAKRLEERNRWFEEGVTFSEMGSRWDSMELKKGNVPVPVIDAMDSEVTRKWVELETLSFRDMSPQSLIGAQAQENSSTEQTSEHLVRSMSYHLNPEEAQEPVRDSKADVTDLKQGPLSKNGLQNGQTSAAEALQKEATSLRKQVETIKKEHAALGIEVDSPCGPGAPCRARLQAMEVAHRNALQELQEKHAKELEELEKEKDRMLQEESRAAAKALEALRAAHRGELDREVQKARRSTNAGITDSSSTGHVRVGADALQNELDELSESYSQRCLELSRREQHGKSQNAEFSCRDRELEHLRRENQELKTKLAEEISRMRYFITGQRSAEVSHGNAEGTASELEKLLSSKENEVQHLKKEVNSLQNEVQSLIKEKRAA
ncbi:myosin phosphatase Rho-interacting protein-like isoform X1 [Gouania willdenowi]|uniref:myosin phosphatase Rho-interacting protein-like isoform X1 n=1 Tax=Gouania willdenowi TaxID=441366 RepID=UPI001055DD15|nr:myosin phosphatase Rho-interacting protein-like isoform X1 [Gouania willdenowi]